MAEDHGRELVHLELAKRRRPVSVRRLTDKLQKADHRGRRFNEDEVRRWLEQLVDGGEAVRSRGRFRRTVRYRAA